MYDTDQTTIASVSSRTSSYSLDSAWRSYMSDFMYERNALVEDRVAATEEDSTVLEDTIVSCTAS
jgi:hypothetical protein